jgi:hypothetical protein
MTPLLSPVFQKPEIPSPISFAAIKRQMTAMIDGDRGAGADRPDEDEDRQRDRLPARPHPGLGARGVASIRTTPTIGIGLSETPTPSDSTCPIACPIQGEHRPRVGLRTKRRSSDWNRKHYVVLNADAVG